MLSEVPLTATLGPAVVDAESASPLPYPVKVTALNVQLVAPVTTVQAVPPPSNPVGPADRASRNVVSAAAADVMANVTLNGANWVALAGALSDADGPANSST